jgi:hypothetical protein
MTRLADPARGLVPDHLSVLGRIADGPSTLEFFHNTPSGDELAACLIKHGEFRHFLSLRRMPPSVPTQWVISSGRPDSGIDGLWLRPIAGCPERTLALPILLRLRLTVPSDPAKQTTDDQEFLMDTQDIVETWRREAIQEGVKEGVKQGVANSLVEVYEARFGTMPEDLHTVVEDTDDEPTLVAWLRLAGTRSADEIAAAIRSFRAS